jgi:PST family polysaccharide transporter
MADRALRMVIGLLVGVWIARYLGPEQFGLYNYAVAFVFLFGTIAALGGLDGIVVRDIIREPAAKEEILGTAFALRLMAGLLTFLLATGVGVLLRPGDKQSLMLVGLIAASQLFLAFDTIDFWFQSQVQSKYTVYAKNAAFLIMCVVRVALILSQATIIAFAVAALCEVVLGAGMLVMFYRKTAMQRSNWRVSFVRAKTLLSLSWPLILAGGAGAIYMKIDQVMLGNMLGDKAVGIYSAAVKVTEVWNVIPLAVVSSLYPSFIAIHQMSQEQYYERWKKVVRGVFWGAVALSTAIAVFSSAIVGFLYGESYAQAAGVVAIHSYSGIGVSVSAVLNYQFALDGQTRINLWHSAGRDRECESKCVAH